MSDVVVPPTNLASARFWITLAPDWSTAATTVPAGDVMDPVVIRYGRQNIDEDFPAASITFTLAHPDQYYPVTNWGALVRAYYRTGAGAFAYVGRFQGFVTDRHVEWIAGGSEAANLLPMMQVTAIGPLASASRTMVGDEPWPEETDRARLDRLANLIPSFTYYGWRPDPGGMMLAARDVDRRDALELMQIASRSGGGIVVEQPDGVEWHDRSHRAREAVAIRFAARDVLVTPAIEAIGPAANRVIVAYGPENPAAGARPEVEATDPDSISTYGPIGIRVDVETRDGPDALDLATYWLGRRARAAWGITGLEVELDHPDHPVADDAVWQSTLMALRIGDLVAVDELPAGGPVTGGVLYIEGWTETISAADYRLAYAVSDWSLSNSATAWSDVDSVLQWQQVDPAVTWATWDAPPTIRSELAA